MVAVLVLVVALGAARGGGGGGTARSPRTGTIVFGTLPARAGTDVVHVRAAEGLTDDQLLVGWSDILRSDRRWSGTLAITTLASDPLVVSSQRPLDSAELAVLVATLRAQPWVRSAEPVG